ncbi:hypothetical protein EV426DRAFT_571384 [Tirmania nivea]|nr:hypothetical protein EV426DRAFT_571384 [Tirmania nivea]
MVLGFSTPKSKELADPELADPDLEYVWLGDVETGHYASVLGSPNYQEAVKAYARGEKMNDPPNQDPDQFINEFTPNGRAIASLIKTGFLSAQDYVVLDNSAATLREVKAAGGEQGLDTLLNLATPRREKFKRQLLEKYDADHNVPENKRFKVARLNDLQPGVQTYIWALDEAARKRQRTRMRRRAIARQRQQELRYDAYLRRGGAPFRGSRTDAETFEEVEEKVPVSGKAYIEQNHICTYWYNPTLKRWTRMLGVDTSSDNKRKALLANRGRTHDVEDTFDFQLGKRKQQSYGALEEEEKDEIFRCMDREGNMTLRLHHQWFEHKYPLPTNKGECEGLCSFNDGWIFPEGEDGLPNDIDLAFDEHGEPLPTHVTCAACNIRLCRKCYFTMMKYHANHGPNLAQFIDIYYHYRTEKENNPMEFTTYVDFLNNMMLKNPKALKYNEEDPTLSSEYYKNNDRRSYESRQGAASQREMRKKQKISHKQQGQKEQGQKEQGQKEQGQKELTELEKGELQLQQQLKMLREELQQNQRQFEQLKLQQKPEAGQLQLLLSLKKKAAREKAQPPPISSAMTTPPTSPEPEDWDWLVGPQNKSQRQKVRNLIHPPNTTTQTNPPGGAQQPPTKTISVSNPDIEQQLRDRELRGEFSGRRQPRRPR